jgi:predicted RNA binding protein YcfA (HicA-like mRNA interferase family)
MSFKVTVVIEQDDDGYYAYAPENEIRVVIPFHAGKILHPKIVKQVLTAVGKEA